MKSKENKKTKKLTKKQISKLNITCPYCGKKAYLQNSSYVHGEKAVGSRLYVCSAYPTCDSYVSAHKYTFEPQGTLANKELRKKRIEAHRYFNKIMTQNIMTKREIYLWLQCKLNLTSEIAHIAMLNYEQCIELISHCKKLVQCNSIAC